ncbi:MULTISPECIES: arylsulfatase [unclassified Spirosoma]|uniref:arylsulfatase n=1 Tax=unclassified Spirosoma TaxID=2621999 RepID=UPI00096716EE|nr:MULTISPECIES: arylsulfatase [unclassified Spirosoma]MBN8824899.1 arylsulfatase [Spirosoma sp.]OJW74777.1 MAG: arylsulfatase [Spirosoma sp. 48-14]
MKTAIILAAIISGCVLLGAIPSKQSSIPSVAPKPNIVLIMADDMGYSDLGCYGSEIPTPNLDKLAREGVRFTQFYNTARCCPTRAALMTGLFQHQAGIGHMTKEPNNRIDYDYGVDGYRGELNRHCVTIAEVLKTAGYHTYMAGKWHLGSSTPDLWPRQRGFDRYYGLLAGASSYLDPIQPRGIWQDNEPVEKVSQPFYTTDAFTDNALVFLKEQNDQQPFFLYLAFTSPHWPLHALNEDIERFRGKYRQGWDVLREQRFRKQVKEGIATKDWGLSARPDIYPAWAEQDTAKQREMDYRMAVYAAQVYRMDQNVGKLVDYLTRSGKLANTLLVFLSDNGACQEGGVVGGGALSDINDPAKGGAISYGGVWANASNTPFKGFKHVSYEGGIATPLIVHYPASISRQKGKVVTAPGYLIDIMPTFIEVSGATYPTEARGQKIYPIEGRSLLPILTSGTRQPHEFMYWEHENHRAIRYGKWKAVGVIGAPWELYDLEADRTEQHNLAANHPDLVKKLDQQWNTWANTHSVFPKGTMKADFSKEWNFFKTVE